MVSWWPVMVGFLEALTKVAEVDTSMRSTIFGTYECCAGTAQECCGLAVPASGVIAVQ